MTRLSSTPNTNAVSAPHTIELVFWDLDFPSGHLRISSADHTISIGGNSYQGAGQLLSDDGFSEEGTGSPQEITISLAGVDNSLITTVLAEKYHKRSAVRYTGWLDENGVLVDTPYQSWEGSMEKMAIQLGESSSTVSLSCESIFILWNQARNWIYSDEHHKMLMGTGDNFFDQLAPMQNKVIKWGDAVVDVGSNGVRAPGRTPTNLTFTP
jgi:hypothetical protein